LQTAAAELGRRVWEPLRPHLGDARTVLIAPDGGLSFFPFGALPGSKPGSYLLEDLAIGYVGSGRAAIEALADPQGPAGRGLLAVGDVDFQADPGQPGPSVRPQLGVPLVAQRAGFRSLPGTGPEARRACKLFQSAFADQGAELLIQAEPTEAAIKRRLDGGHWRVVHLGTHGFFESPARIAALRAAVRREDPFAPPLKAAKPGKDDLDFALTPWLRSGIALAGGGREPGAGPVDASADGPLREDGILTAEEVQALDLRGTELVVLSACETGLGALEHGQGVLGLQRAFHAAGARAVVASLWKVDDAATSVLMEQFYTNLWVKKMSKLEALRQAQLTVLNDPGLVTRRRAELAKERGISETAEKLPEGVRVAAPSLRDTRSDPSLWAAFVLSGDGR
jgi:CHAT domain-containing protein